MDLLEGIPPIQGNLPMKSSLSMKGNTRLVANSIAMVEPLSWTLVSPIRFCNVGDDRFKDKSSKNKKDIAAEGQWALGNICILSLPVFISAEGEPGHVGVGLLHSPQHLPRHLQHPP